MEEKTFEIPGYVVQKPVYKHNSIVYHGFSKSDRREVVIKLLPTRDAQKEISILKVLEKPSSHIGQRHTVSLLDFVELDKESCLIFPMLAALPDTPTADTVKMWAYELLQAISFCHSRGVVHVDIKPANIMLDPSTKRIVLIDYGHSTTTQEVSFACPSTPAYEAPELLMEDASSYTEKMDIWSAGVTIAEWFLGCLLFVRVRDCFDAMKQIHNFFKQRNWQFTFPADRSRSGYATSDAAELLTSMLQESPEDRLSAVECLHLPIFNGVPMKCAGNVGKNLAVSERIEILIRHSPEQLVPMEAGTVRVLVDFLLRNGITVEELASAIGVNEADVSSTSAKTVLWLNTVAAKIARVPPAA